MNPEQSQQGGDRSTLLQAGRDIVQTTINYENRLQAMQKLVKLYNDEKAKGNQSQYLKYIRKLEKFTTNIDGELMDLKQKLIIGGYSTEVDWALELKEEYSKILQENKFSLACQHIHAFLLAWIIVLFNQFVAEAIKTGQTKEVVKQIMIDKVIAPVENLTGGENNVLELFSDDITGMIYYLTGNCHLKWN
jgi:hypothetical protein